MTSCRPSADTGKVTGADCGWRPICSKLRSQPAERRPAGKRACGAAVETKRQEPVPPVARPHLRRRGNAGEILSLARCARQVAQGEHPWVAHDSQRVLRLRRATVGRGEWQLETGVASAAGLAAGRPQHQVCFKVLRRIQSPVQCFFPLLLLPAGIQAARFSGSPQHSLERPSAQPAAEAPQSFLECCFP